MKVTSESKGTQSCQSLCDPMDYTVHGILQARILKPFPSRGDLPNPGIELGSPALQADSLPSELSEKPRGHSINTKIQIIFLSYDTVVTIIQIYIL